MSQVTGERDERVKFRLMLAGVCAPPTGFLTCDDSSDVCVLKSMSL